MICLKCRRENCPTDDRKMTQGEWIIALTDCLDATALRAGLADANLLSARLEARRLEVWTWKDTASTNPRVEHMSSHVMGIHYAARLIREASGDFIQPPPEPVKVHKTLPVPKAWVGKAQQIIKSKTNKMYAEKLAAIQAAEMATPESTGLGILEDEDGALLTKKKSAELPKRIPTVAERVEAVRLEKLARARALQAQQQLQERT